MSCCVQMEVSLAYFSAMIAGKSIEFTHIYQRARLSDLRGTTSNDMAPVNARQAAWLSNQA